MAAATVSRLTRYMDEIVVPLHRKMGMHVVGAFTVVGDEDAFVWIRRSEDAADRDQILDAVHRHPGSAEMIEAVAALVGSAGSIVRLEPTSRSVLR